jgi:hypothetical protein
MSAENNSKNRGEHLNLINQKFDELDELITSYLNHVRNNGGTTGFCIGSLRAKIRYCRERINNMCGRFSDYIPELIPQDNTSQHTNMDSNTYWENNLKDYIIQNHPDKLHYNPKLLKVTKDNISFGMKKHMGVLILSKKKIIESLYPHLN